MAKKKSTPMGEPIPDEMLDHATGGIDRDTIQHIPFNGSAKPMIGFDVMCPYCKKEKTSLDNMVCPACKEMFTGDKVKSQNLH